MKRLTLIVASTVAMLALTAGSAFAVPAEVSFTARVSDGSGPIDGTVNLEFELFDAATSGSSTGWSETYNNVTADNGLVYVSLGSQSGFNEADFDGTDVWLEITVNGTAQTPRLAIQSVPYSVHAATSDTLGSLTPSDVALSNHTHTQYAATNHSHTEYAASSHTHNYAATNHTHTEYAASSHTHNYAAASHTHGAGDIDAYADLSASGRLDNNASSDILTRTQGDGRYSLTSHTHAASGGLLGYANLAAPCVSATAPDGTYASLLDFGNYTKQSATSRLVVTWGGMCRASSIAGNGVTFEVRVSGSAPTGNAGRSTIRPGTDAVGSTGVPCGGTAVFTGTAGSKTIGMYVRGWSGTGPGAMIDPGCFSSSWATVQELE